MRTRLKEHHIALREFRIRDYHELGMISNKQENPILINVRLQAREKNLAAAMKTKRNLIDKPDQ